MTIDTSNPSILTPNQSAKIINLKISRTPKPVEIYQRANEAVDDHLAKKLLRIITNNSSLKMLPTPTSTSMKKKIKVKNIENRNPPTQNLPELTFQSFVLPEPADSNRNYNVLGFNETMGTIKESSENTQPFVNPANGMNFTLGNFNEKEYYPANMKVLYDTMP